MRINLVDRFKARRRGRCLLVPSLRSDAVKLKKTLRLKKERAFLASSVVELCFDDIHEISSVDPVQTFGIHVRVPKNVSILKFRNVTRSRPVFRLDALALSVIATATWLAGWVGGCLSQPVLYQND